jgi:hypothetical protein
MRYGIGNPENPLASQEIYPDILHESTNREKKYLQ